VTSGRAATRAAWTLGSALLVASLSFTFMDLLGDSFWTLALGRDILTTGALPAHDPFAYTSVHEPYRVHMPATAVLFAWLAAHGGLAAVAALAALVNAGAWLVVWLVPTRRSAARALTLPLVLLGVFLTRQDLCARGQVFGSLCFGILLVALDAVRRGAKVPAIVPFALAVAWTNLHPSFVLAVAWPLACAAASRVDPPAGRAPARPLVVFAAFAAAGTMVTPYGPGLVADVLKLMGDPTTAQVDLFQSPNFRSPGWLALVALTLTVMTLRASYGPSVRRASDVTLLAILLAAACGARRYGELLWLAALFELGRVSDDAFANRRLPAAGWAARLLVPATVMAAGLELAVAAALLRRPKDFLFQVPAAATAFVRQAWLPDHVYAPYHWGGYLDWALEGRRKVFIDGRNMLFHNGVMEDAQVIQRAQPGWPQLLEGYAIDTLITERRSPLEVAVAIDPAWQQLFQDERASVFARKAHPPR
jgi:hypothetical protein